MKIRLLIPAVLVAHTSLMNAGDALHGCFPEKCKTSAGTAYAFYKDVVYENGESAGQRLVPSQQDLRPVLHDFLTKQLRDQ
jgi:hypothetical protein